jgi:hypothetical protein
MEICDLLYFLLFVTCEGQFTLLILLACYHHSQQVSKNEQEQFSFKLINKITMYRKKAQGREGLGGRVGMPQKRKSRIHTWQYDAHQKSRNKGGWLLLLHTFM